MNRTTIASIACASLLVACSGGGQAAAPDHDSGDPDVLADSGGPPSSPDGGGSLGAGEISISTDYLGGGVVSPFLNVGASFVAAGGPSGRPVETVDAGLGSCTFSQQPYPPVSSSATFVSAGALTVTGGGASFTIEPSGVTPILDAGSGVDYQLAIPDAGAVSTGEAFTFAASGATAPAFSMSVGVPDAVVLTLPAFGPSSSVVIPRSADLPLAWSGGGAGDLVFGINQFVGGTLTSVTCTFPESAGSGTVPAALLARFTPSSEIDAGGLSLRPLSVTLYTFATQAIVASGWRLVATIVVSSLIPPGVNVTLQ